MGAVYCQHLQWSTFCTYCKQFLSHTHCYRYTIVVKKHVLIFYLKNCIHLYICKCTTYISNPKYLHSHRWYHMSLLLFNQDVQNFTLLKMSYVGLEMSANWIYSPLTSSQLRIITAASLHFSSVLLAYQLVAGIFKYFETKFNSRNS